MSKANRAVPVERNDDITLTIDALNSEGQGVGRVDGYAVFVPGALIGETVNAHVIKATSSYAAAKLTGIVTVSPERVAPVCPSYTACGGCAMQHIEYGAQLECKRRFVEDAFSRIGRLENIEVLPVIGMDDPWHYRNKGSFPIAADNDKPAFGFFAERSHRLVPLNDCLIQDARVTAIPRAVCEWARERRIAPYDEASHTGILRHVMARTSAGGEVMAVVVTTGALPYETELIQTLRKAGAKTAVHNINSARTNAILGPKFRTLFGQGVICDELCGLKLRVSAAAFLQVNHTQTERLYSEAMARLAPNGVETVLDVYCGMGSISLLIARKARRVIGVENVPQAVENARENAALNGIDNDEFICGEAERELPKLIAGGLRPDAVIVDPPRKGCDEDALKAIAQCGANRLVYVSCDPATLARDCRIMTEYGFEVKTVQPVDMFPHTAHVETVVLMLRK